MGLCEVGGMMKLCVVELLKVRSNSNVNRFKDLSRMEAIKYFNIMI